MRTHPAIGPRNQHNASGDELSDYALELLREDEEFILYRGRTSTLAKPPEAAGTPRGLRRVEACDPRRSVRAGEGSHRRVAMTKGLLVLVGRASD